MLSQQPTDRRAQQVRGPAPARLAGGRRKARRCRGGADNTRLHRARDGLSTLHGPRGLSRPRVGVTVDSAEQLPGPHVFLLLLEDLEQNAGAGGGNLDGDLVGFELE